MKMLAFFLQPACFARASCDIKTRSIKPWSGWIGWSQQNLNYGVIREQSDREHSKRINGAGALCNEFCPLSVLLFGVTTLRVTWNATWSAARQWNSRQRTKFNKINASTGSDWSWASKISSFQNFEIFGVMEMLASFFITRLIRNGQPWYQDRTKPW